MLLANGRSLFSFGGNREAFLRNAWVTREMQPRRNKYGREHINSRGLSLSSLYVITSNLKRNGGLNILWEIWCLSVYRYRIRTGHAGVLIFTLLFSSPLVSVVFMCLCRRAQGF